jgi:hypothetical protein
LRCVDLGYELEVVLEFQILLQIQISNCHVP